MDDEVFGAGLVAGAVAPAEGAVVFELVDAADDLAGLQAVGALGDDQVDRLGVGGGVEAGDAGELDLAGGADGEVVAAEGDLVAGDLGRGGGGGGGRRDPPASKGLLVGGGGGGLGELLY